MKLRIRGDSLRFRLTQAEVAQLAAEGRVEDAVRLGPRADDRLVYAIEASAQCAASRAWLAGGAIGLTLPARLAQEWAQSDQVGIEYEQTLPGGASLRIAVEKDFRCLHGGRGEDESDNFPNPHGETEG